MAAAVSALRLRLVPLTVVLALVWALTPASAHATLVIGSLTVAPDPAVAGQQMALTITLVDPLLVPVEDALVRVELRDVDPEDPQVPPSITGTEASEFLQLTVVVGSEYLQEVEDGVYVGTLPAPAPGRYTLSVRDTTFRNEEAIANVGLDIAPAAGGAAASGATAFVLPPTPLAPSSIGTWLLWIIGIPLAIGVIVTVLALRAKPAGTEPPTTSGSDGVTGRSDRT